MFDKLFSGFTDVKQFLDVVGNSVSQKAVAAKQTADVTAQEAGNVADSANDYDTYAQEQLGRLKMLEAQGTEARRMADSGNLFDRISLIGDQMLNPRAYTREGRTGQIAEIGQDLSLRGQIHNIDVNAANARIEVAKAHEAQATVDLDTGLLKVKTQIDALQLANQGILATETLRQNNLTLMEAPALKSALVGPVAPNGKITLGGFQYTPTEVRERSTQLDTREKLSMLTPQAADPDFAGKLRVKHSLDLSTYTLPELETLRKQGLTMPDGTHVEPQVWEDAYGRAQRVQADEIVKMQNDVLVKNTLPVMLTEAQTMLTSGSKYISPGTPAAAAKAQFQAAMQTVAISADSNQDPAAKAIQVKALAAAQDEYVKSIQKEATRKAGGDKDLAGLYTSQMLGEMISPQQVQDIAVSRYTDYKGFGDFLPPETSTKLQKFADQELVGLRQENAQADLDPSMGKRSEKEMRQEAMRRGFVKVAEDVGIDAMNTLQAVAAKRDDNPALRSAGMAPGAILELSKRASEMGITNIVSKYKLTPEQLTAIRASRFNDVPGMDSQTAQSAASEINAQSISAEYDLLDAQKPGLGYAMQQWYAKTLPEMARNYTMGLDATQRALIGDGILNQAQKFVDVYTAVDESAVHRAAGVANQMAIGAKKPVNFWPVMLAMDDRLADSQRQQIMYDIISPMMTSASAKGMNEEQSMELVFNQIANFANPNDPSLTAAVKSFSRNLPKQLDNFDTMWKVMAAQRVPGDSQGGYDNQRAMQWDWNGDVDSATRHLQGILPWLQRDSKQQ
jgi:hypothetical protein